MADSPILVKSFEFALKIIRLSSKLDDAEELIRILTAIVKTAGRPK
ncbi:MAG: hypothetical protein Q8K18_02525 [Burkholderiales bacterium]|nr:hypothetical protein [Burkholderiales bacterium]